MMASSALYQSPALGGQGGSSPLSLWCLPRFTAYRPALPSRVKSNSDISSVSIKKSAASSGFSSKGITFQQSSSKGITSQQSSSKGITSQQSITQRNHTPHNTSSDTSLSVLRNVKKVENWFHPSGTQSEKSDHYKPSESSSASNGTPKTATCFVCRHQVEENYFKQPLHLFFGPVKCIKCDTTCEDCAKFKSITGNIENDCDHAFEFTNDPFNFIASRLSGDIDHGNEGSLVTNDVILKFAKYILEIDWLSHKPPWSKAIQLCIRYLPVAPKASSSKSWDVQGKITNKYSVSSNVPHLNKTNLLTPPKGAEGNLMSASRVHQETANEHVLSQTYDLESLDEATEYIELASEAELKSKVASQMPQPTRKRKAKKLNHEPVETPEDGSYLVVNKAIEECPMCYTLICPSRFRVNVVSYLVTTVCIGCDLTIYFAVSPNVSIVTDIPTVSINRRGRPCKKRKKNKLTNGPARGTNPKDI